MPRSVSETPGIPSDTRRPRRIRRAIVAVALIAVVVAEIAAAVALLPFAVPVGLAYLNLFPSSGGAPAPIQSADRSGSGPGTLVSATTMPGVTRRIEARGLRAARVLYRSTNGDTGEQTVVSGSVFVPTGTPPPGGWRVVAVGHGTLGIDGPCAPSLSDNMMGLLPFVTAFTGRGFAVAVADYEGLGTKGNHPYLDARTAGLNIIDSVRALRHTFGDVSSAWMAFGHSQGGAATWAADEQAGRYAAELTLMGAVAAAPAADVSGFVDKALAHTLTPDQLLAMPVIVESLARRHPDLNRDDYRSGAATKYWQVLTACQAPEIYQRGDAGAQLRPEFVAPRDAAAADRLRRLLRDWALPQRPLSAPLSVWYGGADTLVDSAWTAAAIAKACAMGGTVTVQFEPGKGHGDVDLASQLDWMAKRFADQPVRDDC
ncbi:lipase family protein [Mycolicibacterium cosmeticum]|uniref:lipase family protein n=1 Tax=Mycolicibacterium cosmeticum TaxID=258533 RepID=UPI000AE5F658|nr:lipase family protein [Mycolicibacterium cosmeticum]